MKLLCKKCGDIIESSRRREICKCGEIVIDINFFGLVYAHPREYIELIDSE